MIICDCWSQSVYSDLHQSPIWHTSLRSILLQQSRMTSCHWVRWKKSKNSKSFNFSVFTLRDSWTIQRDIKQFLQDLSSDPVLLSSVEGFGVEHYVCTVARLGAGDVALTTQLHPRHSQNWPADKDFCQWRQGKSHSYFKWWQRQRHTPAVSIRKGEDVVFIVLQTRHTTWYKKRVKYIKEILTK